ncbi:apoptotic chromatin condensation inducer in the nucleus isoform X2 [Cimex lectularius]|uniref:RRM domain-containing protein n=1 Tax=Cimex lectularius TaxID=79782 RepID=A0A8I6TJ00_CIMLE|nr:apoptotic chromatin condensation inducer in the nucleus isoform X2 [Cimex lectularius]
MVRKSERNKHGTPDKSVEKASTRKSSRQTRRRKKSTSESEPEPDIPVEKETKREKHEEKAETSDAHTRLRRSARTKNTPDMEAEMVEKAKSEEVVENSDDKEWKDDSKFWEAQPAKPEEAKPAENEEEGLTWKVQSSNGSGGEIQKLKICRQRLTDSAESSSSPTKETTSPRRKRATKEKHDPESAESTGSHTDSEAPLQINPEENVKQEAPTEKESADKEGNLSEEKAEKTTEKEVEVQKPADIAETPIVNRPSIPEKEEGELDTTVEGSDVQKSSECESMVVEANQVAINEETQDEKEDCTKEKISTKEPVNEKLENASIDISLSNEIAMEEIAMEEIAKKLNERAAAKGAKEIPEEKEKKVNDSAKTPDSDLDTTKEEGEISSAAETPEPVKKQTMESRARPTALKRLTEEIPTSLRKRRTSKQIKPQKDSQIAISSLTLKTLVPDVAPVPLEEVKEMLTIEKEEAEKKKLILESQDDGVAAEEDEGPGGHESKHLRESKDKKSKTPERKRSFKEEGLDNNEVKKKKIIIKHKDEPKVDVKVNNQENHKAARKISIVSDDAKTLRKSPSPSVKKATNILYITNLVRPFTVPQLKELLARTGTLAPNGFFIDKIKSKCYVKYTTVEMAVETRHALHGVRWPVNNPKTLKVEFSNEQNLNIMLRLAEEEHNAAIKQEVAAIDKNERLEVKEATWGIEKNIIKPSSRRVTTSIREWDMGKMPGNENQAPNQTQLEVKKEEWVKNKDKNKLDSENRRRQHSPEKSEIPRKLKKKDNEAPAKLLDGLFRKTKATPRIYWLPLTTAQIVVREEMRRQQLAEHERRLAQAEQRKTESRRDKDKERDRERERDRDRDRDRDRERVRERDRRKK